MIGGSFIRIPVFVDTVLTSEGIMKPCTRECMIFRQQLDAKHIKVLADIHVKHSHMLASHITVEQSAKTAVECGADAIIVTGSSVGTKTPIEMIERVRQVVSIPIFVGSGVNEKNIAKQLAITNGVIIGSGFKKDGIISNRISDNLAKRVVRAGPQTRERNSIMIRPMKLGGKELLFETGCLEYLRKIETKRAFIVLGGKSMENNGILLKVEGYLKKANVAFDYYKGVETDPSIDTVLKGSVKMCKFRPDLIIALGGGSVMDAAKAMWVFYEHPELKELKELLPPNSFPKLRKKAHLCCIPSTSGSECK